MSRSEITLMLLTLSIAAATASCEEDRSSSTTTGTGGTGGTTMTGGAGGVGGSGGIFTSTDEEICDGLDNDENGTVDEVCTCSGTETQQCYPANHVPPEGCEWGEQSCSGSAWGPCLGASLPPDGQDACCTVLGDTPDHELLDDYLAAYPPASMPKTVAAVTAFAPEVNGHGMSWQTVNPGNEVIDSSNSGVITTNIETGLGMSRQAAEDSMPTGATLEDVREEVVIIEDLGGTCNGAPSGVGWAWGSILYQATDQSVSELVYLYIGLCAENVGGDVEGFYYSDQPVELCAPPIVPR
ncbi:MAG: hypothetical protein JRI68_32005 [Deltaproteobacteria bacterium]|nr:hypothetical protein [Deltaproteobacteria bacterium]